MRKIVVEIDSQIVYYVLMKNLVYLSHFGGLILDIKKASEVFDFFSFNWVRRSGNYMVHCFSHFTFACDLLYFSSSIPMTIVNSVDANISII